LAGAGDARPNLAFNMPNGKGDLSEFSMSPSDYPAGSSYGGLGRRVQRDRVRGALSASGRNREQRYSGAAEGRALISPQTSCDNVTAEITKPQ
jgi:hypothetical protein